MEIVVNPVEVELAGMKAWANKLSNKMIWWLFSEPNKRYLKHCEVWINELS